MASKTLKVVIAGDSKGGERAFADLDSAAEKSSSGIGDKFGKAFGLLTLGAAAAGVAAAAVLTKGFFESLDVEAASDKLAAQLGLDPAEQERIGGIAGKLYGEAYGDSLGTVNEAIKGVIQQGLVWEGASSEQIEGITAKVLDLTTAFDQDLTRATAAAGTLIKNGLAKDADEAMDIITRGFQTGTDKGEDFLDTLIEYPSVLTKLGLSGIEATGLLSQGLEAGARNADIVADALKEFQIRATDASTLSAEGFKLIGLNAAEMTAKIAAGGPGAKEGLDQVLDGLRAMEDPVARNTAGVALFGTKWEDMGNSLLALDVDTAAAQLGVVGGAAERMGDTLNDNVKTKLEAFKRQGMQKLTEFMGNVVIPAFETAAPKIRAALDDSIGWINREVVPRAQAAISWFMENVWPRLQEGFAAAKGWVSDFATFFSTRWAAIKQAIHNVIAVFKVVWAPAILAARIAWDHVGEIVRIAWDHVRAVIDSAVQIIKGVIDVFLGILTLDFGRVWDGIKAIVGGAWDWIKAQTDLVLDLIKVGISMAWDFIKAAAGAAWDGIKALIGLAWDGIKAAIDTVIETIKGVISGAWETIKSTASDAWEGIKSTISEAWEGIKSTASEGVDAVVGFFASLPGKVAAFAGGVLSAGADVGREVVDGLKNGLEEVGGFAGDVADSILGAFKRGWNVAANAINDFIPDKISIPLAPDIDLPDNPVPRFHSGGVVPGRPGQEVLAILEAGETVIPAGGGGGGVDGSGLDGAATALVAAARALLAAAAAQSGGMSRSEIQRAVRAS